MRDPAPSRPDGLVVVLGGGIAGLAAADRLSRAGLRVLVLERRPHAGGMHQARHIGPYTFDAGSIFYEENAGLFGLAPGLRGLCPGVTRVQRRIAPDGSVRHYPFEPRELLDQPLPDLVHALADLAWARLMVRRDGTLDALCHKRLGRRLFVSTGLASYIARFHHIPPDGIDESFFFHRMAYVARVTRPGGLARMAMRSLPHATSACTRKRPPLRVRPREGFSPLFERIIAHLAARGVEFRFGEELFTLQRKDRFFLLCTTTGAFPAEAVVSTVPLDTLHKAMFGTGSGLVSLDMTTLFVSAAKLDPRLGNVLYNFHRIGWWKRVTIYSRIYPEPDTGRDFFAVEATIPQDGRHDPGATFTDFQRHMTGLGLAEDLVLEGHEHVEGCYPLYTPGSGVNVRQVLDRISRTEVVLAGRQGRFEYLPTSSGVIRRVAEELDAARHLATVSGRST
ncbi:FAD-dependent oxidoreductase [Novosphingobium album (ex Hu et al. 2023)]|uniref:FAD-dependent oxidoreductase n=1 Tax=Novosphingobium album (ex Hu et al. 2023) TaxID=2930093 RepID=A0ABT0B4P3_9SPHN|nr:FAD-dependent oxidoreductase [Novosphingobium album (ex Hu et al. 2023)]MCJ2180010.1 FAD-dependent oxidoreductase [Novosphingobium album (ex Hu et al. 2023)]